MLERIILHCDLNGFYASVECVLNPSLQFVPMAVAGDPKNRHGIILAKNELAKKYNIQTAETIWQAKKKCPELVLVPPHHSEYKKYSYLVNQIYNEFTDLVEPFGIDESWLDITGVLHLFGSGLEIADQIRNTVRARLGLTISVGVSFNKVFAKLGSDYKKPDATTLITQENYKQIAWSLPVSNLLYVGKVATETLAKLRITTIGDLANSDKTLLYRLLGKMGVMIHDYANGIDKSPVKSAFSERNVKSVGNGMTFPRDLYGLAQMKSAVFALSDEVTGRMRHCGVKATVISVVIKAPDFKCISKQKTLSIPTHLTREVAIISLDLIRSCWPEGAPIRSLTITATNLISSKEAGEQLSLFAADSSFDKEKHEKLAVAMDHIRQKYGRGSIQLGSELQSPEK